jgi:N-acetylmuramoyl-L-alanine amidase
MNKKRIMTLSAILFLILAMTTTVCATIYYGSTDSETIKKVQTRLKSWGYYSGTVDGSFGAKTEQAVRLFQQKNGLTVDGKIGKGTLAALGLPTGSTSSSSSSSGSSTTANNNDVMLLARCINGEARGEPYNGQVAVAAVILNRVDDSGFPNTLSGVIYQAGAFDAVKDGQVNLTPSDSCIRAAKEALAGNDPTNGALYYYNPTTATNKWIRSRTIVLTIGKHVFCL